MNPLVEIKNFDKKELMCKCGCDRFNYDDNFLVRLQAFRLKHNSGLIVTSGGRCVQHNKNVGGVPTSLHECETKPASACDVTGDCERIYQEACAIGLFNEVIWYQKSNFVHLGYSDKKNTPYYKIKKEG